MVNMQKYRLRRVADRLEIGLLSATRSWYGKIQVWHKNIKAWNNI